MLKEHLKKHFNKIRTIKLKRHHYILGGFGIAAIIAFASIFGFQNINTHAADPELIQCSRGDTDRYIMSGENGTAILICDEGIDELIIEQKIGTTNNNININRVTDLGNNKYEIEYEGLSGGFSQLYIEKNNDFYATDLTGKSIRVYDKKETKKNYCERGEPNPSTIHITETGKIELNCINEVKNIEDEILNRINIDGNVLRYTGTLIYTGTTIDSYIDNYEFEYKGNNTGDVAFYLYQTDISDGTEYITISETKSENIQVEKKGEIEIDTDKPVSFCTIKAEPDEGKVGDNGKIIVTCEIEEDAITPQDLNSSNLEYSGRILDVEETGNGLFDQNSKYTYTFTYTGIQEGRSELKLKSGAIHYNYNGRKNEEAEYESGITISGSCHPDWDNDYFINSEFWNLEPSPTSGNIICALYGEGKDDLTAYTTGRDNNEYEPGNTCTNMEVIFTGELPNELSGNTIYVLTSETIEIGSEIELQNCTAIISNQTGGKDTTIEFTGEYGGISGGNFGILDNISIYSENYNNGRLGISTWNSNMTLNVIKIYNRERGIDIRGNNNILNNIQSYGNGIGINLNGEHNAINNSQIYRNNIGLNIEGSYDNIVYNTEITQNRTGLNVINSSINNTFRDIELWNNDMNAYVESGLINTAFGNISQYPITNFIEFSGENFGNENERWKSEIIGFERVLSKSTPENNSERVEEAVWSEYEQVSTTPIFTGLESNQYTYNNGDNYPNYMTNPQKEGGTYLNNFYGIIDKGIEVINRKVTNYSYGYSINEQKDTKLRDRSNGGMIYNSGDNEYFIGSNVKKYGITGELTPQPTHTKIHYILTGTADTTSPITSYDIKTDLSGTVSTITGYNSIGWEPYYDLTWYNNLTGNLINNSVELYMATGDTRSYPVVVQMYEDNPNTDNLYFAEHRYVGILNRVSPQLDVQPTKICIRPEENILNMTGTWTSGTFEYDMTGFTSVNITTGLNAELVLFNKVSTGLYKRQIELAGGSGNVYINTNTAEDILGFKSQQGTITRTYYRDIYAPNIDTTGFEINECSTNIVTISGYDYCATVSGYRLTWKGIDNTKHYGGDNYVRTTNFEISSGTVGRTGGMDITGMIYAEDKFGNTSGKQITGTIIDITPKVIRGTGIDNPAAYNPYLGQFNPTESIQHNDIIELLGANEGACGIADLILTGINCYNEGVEDANINEDNGIDITLGNINSGASFTCAITISDNENSTGVGYIEFTVSSEYERTDPNGPTDLGNPEPECNSDYSGTHYVNNSVYPSRLNDNTDLCSGGTQGNITTSWSGNGYEGIYNRTCINSGWTTNCQANQQRCGDGVRNGDEECDPGSGNFGNGCDLNCHLMTPSCTLTVNPNSGNTPLTTTISGTTETWATYTNLDFGDGSGHDNPTFELNHTYDTAGTFNLTLTVQNNYGGAISGDKPTNTCSTTVTTTTQTTTEFCGDGIVNGDEQCDPEDPNHSGWDDNEFTCDQCKLVPNGNNNIDCTIEAVPPINYSGYAGNIIVTCKAKISNYDLYNTGIDYDTTIIEISSTGNKSIINNNTQTKWIFTYTGLSVGTSDLKLIEGVVSDGIGWNNEATGTVEIIEETDCRSERDNDYFLTPDFWNLIPAPTDTQIACALYGSGGEDQTAYTIGWSGYKGGESCPGINDMNVEWIDDSRPDRRDENTIYVLTKKAYEGINTIELPNCTAIISNQTGGKDTTIEFTGDMDGTVNGITINNGNGILDNISIKGYDKANIGIYINGVNNTLNVVKVYKRTKGINIEGIYNMLNNIQSYGNGNGIELQGNNNAINNSQIYRNDVGLNVQSAEENIVYNTEITQNNKGLYVRKPSNNNIFEDIELWNNNEIQAYVESGLNNIASGYMQQNLIQNYTESTTTTEDGKETVVISGFNRVTLLNPYQEKWRFLCEGNNRSSRHVYTGNDITELHDNFTGTAIQICSGEYYIDFLTGTYPNSEYHTGYGDRKIIINNQSIFTQDRDAEYSYNGDTYPNNMTNPYDKENGYITNFYGTPQKGKGNIIGQTTDYSYGYNINSQKDTKLYDGAAGGKTKINGANKVGYFIGSNVQRYDISGELTKWNNSPTEVHYILTGTADTTISPITHYNVKTSLSGTVSTILSYSGENWEQEIDTNRLNSFERNTINEKVDLYLATGDTSTHPVVVQMYGENVETPYFAEHKYVGAIHRDAPTFEVKPTEVCRRDSIVNMTGTWTGFEYDMTGFNIDSIIVTGNATGLSNFDRYGTGIYIWKIELTGGRGAVTVNTGISEDILQYQNNQQVTQNYYYDIYGPDIHTTGFSVNECSIGVVAVSGYDYCAEVSGYKLTWNGIDFNPIYQNRFWIDSTTVGRTGGIEITGMIYAEDNFGNTGEQLITGKIIDVKPQVRTGISEEDPYIYTPELTGDITIDNVIDEIFNAYEGACGIADLILTGINCYTGTVTGRVEDTNSIYIDLLDIASGSNFTCEVTISDNENSTGVGYIQFTVSDDYNPNTDDPDDPDNPTINSGCTWGNPIENPITTGVSAYIDLYCSGFNVNSGDIDENLIWNIITFSGTDDNIIDTGDIEILDGTGIRFNYSGANTGTVQLFASGEAEHYFYQSADWSTGIKVIDKYDPTYKPACTITGTQVVTIGQTGTITVTCTGINGIATTNLTGGDIEYSGTIISVSDSDTIDGTGTTKTFTFTFTGETIGTSNLALITGAVKTIIGTENTYTTGNDIEVTDTGEPDPGTTNPNEACSGYNQTFYTANETPYLDSGMDLCIIGTVTDFTYSQASGEFSWGCETGATTVACQAYQERCGDGEQNGSETCDEGTLNGQPGYCNASCTGQTDPDTPNIGGDDNLNCSINIDPRTIPLNYSGNISIICSGDNLPDLSTGNLDYSGNIISIDNITKTTGENETTYSMTYTGMNTGSTRFGLKSGAITNGTTTNNYISGDIITVIDGTGLTCTWGPGHPNQLLVNETGYIELNCPFDKISNNDMATIVSLVSLTDQNILETGNTEGQFTFYYTGKQVGTTKFKTNTGAINQYITLHEAYSEDITVYKGIFTGCRWGNPERNPIGIGFGSNIDLYCSGFNLTSNDIEANQIWDIITYTGTRNNPQDIISTGNIEILENSGIKFNYTGAMSGIVKLFANGVTTEGYLFQSADWSTGIEVKDNIPENRPNCTITGTNLIWLGGTGSIEVTCTDDTGGIYTQILANTGIYKSTTNIIDINNSNEIEGTDSPKTFVLEFTGTNTGIVYIGLDTGAVINTLGYGNEFTSGFAIQVVEPDPDDPKVFRCSRGDPSNNPLIIDNTGTMNLDCNELAIEVVGSAMNSLLQRSGNSVSGNMSGFTLNYTGERTGTTYFAISGTIGNVFIKTDSYRSTGITVYKGIFTGCTWGDPRHNPIGIGIDSYINLYCSGFNVNPDDIEENQIWNIITYSGTRENSQDIISTGNIEILENSGIKFNYSGANIGTVQLFASGVTTEGYLFQSAGWSTGIKVNDLINGSECTIKIEPTLVKIENTGLITVTCSGEYRGDLNTEKLEYSGNIIGLGDLTRTTNNGKTIYTIVYTGTNTGQTRFGVETGALIYNEDVENTYIPGDYITVINEINCEWLEPNPSMLTIGKTGNITLNCQYINQETTSENDINSIMSAVSSTTGRVLLYKTGTTFTVKYTGNAVGETRFKLTGTTIGGNVTVNEAVSDTIKVYKGIFTGCTWGNPDRNPIGIGVSTYIDLNCSNFNVDSGHINENLIWNAITYSGRQEQTEVGNIGPQTNIGSVHTIEPREYIIKTGEVEILDNRGIRFNYSGNLVGITQLFASGEADDYFFQSADWSTGIIVRSGDKPNCTITGTILVWLGETGSIEVTCTDDTRGIDTEILANTGIYKSTTHIINIKNSDRIGGTGTTKTFELEFEGTNTGIVYIGLDTGAVINTLGYGNEFTSGFAIQVVDPDPDDPKVFRCSRGDPSNNPLIINNTGTMNLDCNELAIEVVGSAMNSLLQRSGNSVSGNMSGFTLNYTGERTGTTYFAISGTIGNVFIKTNPLRSSGITVYKGIFTGCTWGDPTENPITIGESAYIDLNCSLFNLTSSNIEENQIWNTITYSGTRENPEETIDTGNIVILNNTGFRFNYSGAMTGIVKLFASGVANDYFFQSANWSTGIEVNSGLPGNTTLELTLNPQTGISNQDIDVNMSGKNANWVKYYQTGDNGISFERCSGHGVSLSGDGNYEFTGKTTISSTGTTYIYLCGEGRNNGTGLITGVYTIDTTKPECEIAIYPVDWTNSGVTLSVSITEDNPKLYSWTGYSNMINTTGTKTVYTTGNYSFYMIDAAGNTGICSTGVTNIDTEGPTGDVTYIKGDGEYDNSCTTGSITIKLNTGDSISGYPEKAFARNSTGNDAWTGNNTKTIIENETGTGYIRDNAGNILELAYSVTGIVSTGPTAPELIYPRSGETIISTETKEFTWSGSTADNCATISGYKVYILSGEVIIRSGNTTGTGIIPTELELEDGVYYRYVEANDNFEQTTPSEERPFIIDSLGIQVWAEPVSNDWRTGDVNITMFATGINLSGAKYITGTNVKSFNECLSNGTAYENSGTTTRSTEGTGYLTLCAINQNGEKTGYRTGIYKLDETNPICGNWSYNPPLTQWTNGAVTATLTGSTDNISGIRTGGGSCNITTPNGTCNVIISDNAGRTTTCTSSGATNIDDNDPTGEIIVTNLSGQLPNGCTSGNVKLTLSGSDINGLAEKPYARNSTGENAWTGNNSRILTENESGTGYIKDKAGNIIGIAYNITGISQTGPTITLDRPETGAILTGYVKFTWNLTTNSICQSISGGYTITVYSGTNDVYSGIKTSTEDETTLPEGDYTWNVSVKDILGHTSESDTRPFKVRNGAPTCDIEYTPREGMWTSGDVQSVLTRCTPGTTGFNYTGKLFTGNGRFEFTFRNDLGITGNAIAHVRRIDKEPPVLDEVNEIGTTEDRTPDYTFSTTEAGTIIYGGSCSSNTTHANTGNNTVTFNRLEIGTYRDCTIVVVDRLGNASEVLNVSPFTIRGHGSGPTLEKDYCPDGDYSDSYYDGTCEGPKDICGVYETTGNYTDEMKIAYLYSYIHGITTICGIDDADLYGYLRRDHLAKMLSQYAMNVLGLEPQRGKAGCTSYNDIENESEEMKYFMKTACELNLMGLESDGDTPLKSFYPSRKVTRAEFGTTLSRLIYGDKYNLESEAENTYPGAWYSKHLPALKRDGIMTQIDGDRPNHYELRGYVMLMLMRHGKARIDNVGDVNGRFYSKAEVLSLYNNNRELTCDISYFDSYQDNGSGVIYIKGNMIREDLTTTKDGSNSAIIKNNKLYTRGDSIQRGKGLQLKYETTVTDELQALTEEGNYNLKNCKGLVKNDNVFDLPNNINFLGKEARYNIFGEGYNQ